MSKNACAASCQPKGAYQLSSASPSMFKILIYSLEDQRESVCRASKECSIDLGTGDSAFIRHSFYV